MSIVRKTLLLFFGFHTLLLPTMDTPGAQAPDTPDQKASRADEAGMRLLREKRYAEALEQFRLEAQYAPNLPQGATGEGIALALLGRLEEAEKALNQATQIDPTDWRARRELGIVEWQLNHQDAAAKDLSAIAKLFPDDEGVNILLGQYELGQKNYPQAAAYFAAAPAELARNPRLRLMAAEALLKSGRLDQAKGQLAALHNQPGLTPDERFRLGWLLGRAKQYQEAIDVFKSLPSDYPDRLKLNYGLALAYLEEDDFSHCIETLKPEATGTPSSPEVLSLLGVAEEKSGHTDEAYIDFRRGIEMFPDDDECYLDIATLGAVHLNYDLVLPVVSAGIVRIPRDDKLLLTRGLLYNLKGQRELALADYQKALALAPERASIYVAMAMSYEDENKYSAALDILQQAVQRQLKDVLVYYFLGDVLFRQGVTPNTPQYEQARSAVESALSLDPDFAFAYLQRAKLEMMTRQTQAAIADLERARQLEPNSQAILYQLASAYRQAGRAAEAQQLFASVVQANENEDQEGRVRMLEEIIVGISSNRSTEP